VRIEEALVVQADDTRDQGPEGRIRGGPERPKNRPEVIRKFARLEREPGDHAQTATIATLETPEQLGIGAGIGEEHGAIGGNNFGLQESRRGETVAFREAAKAATLNEPGHADSRATAPVGR
jgi:hypothetical protein